MPASRSKHGNGLQCLRLLRREWSAVPLLLNKGRTGSWPTPVRGRNVQF
jgi:hypothetical protein